MHIGRDLCFTLLATLASTGFLCAGDAEHWAFRKLAAPSVPKNAHANRVRTPIDAFLLHKLEGENLTFAAEADRRVLLRRASFDLIGLPPSIEEIDAFLADTAPDAYERMIDRLLASPHYGERWGRHWLDAAGYADTIKTDNDVNGGATREGMWRYRDYVVRALNADKPRDRMLLEQLAGDQLFTWSKDNAFTPEQKELLIATGFLRTCVDGTNNYERNRPLERFQVLHDTLEIVTGNVLGLTFACARCHDHKFDPITQKDYYRLMAYLTPAYNPANWVQPQFRHVVVSTAAEANEVKAANTELDREIGMLGGKTHTIRQPHEQRLRAARLAKLTPLERFEYESLEQLPGDHRTTAQAKRYQSFSERLQVRQEEVLAVLSADERRKHEALEAQIAELRARRGDVEKIQALYDVGPAPITHLLKRGNHEKPGAEVEPGLPAVLATSSHPVTGTPRRLALARALTEPGSPSAALMARVIVNRAWHHHFGRGIVATPGNFGRSGAPPTHPELLDWLAAEFIRGGWKLKPIHRLIMNSTAYRSIADCELRIADSKTSSNPQSAIRNPQSRLRRLESEVIRDAMLAVSGRLERTVGGPFVAIEGRSDGTVMLARAQADPAGPRRRSLYLYARRNFNLSLLAVFDQPLMATSCTCRSSSAVVPQALALLNDASVIELSGHFARRVAAAGSTPEARVTTAFRLALGRPPRPPEMAAAVELLGRQAKRYSATPAEANERALVHLCQMLFCTNEFIYVE
jgi:hypothetical protein